MNTTCEYEVEGLTLKCDLWFEEGEPQTLDHPGWPDDYTVEKVFLGGVDVTKIIDPAIIHRIEERARTWEKE